MRAMIIRDYGGPEMLEPAELPMPEPREGELLVRVLAIAVNPADGKWRSGMFAAHAPIRFPHVLGYDIAGQVVSGPGFARGARVAAMLDPLTKGGYAQYAAIPAGQVAAVPDGMAIETAAALPTAGLTGLQMVEALSTLPDEVLLVTGAVGAVGRFAMLAARRRGTRVIAAVRASQIAEALALGADHAVDISAEWEGGQFDHVLDTLGGPQVGRLCRHLRPEGTILTAATTTIEGAGPAAMPVIFAVQPSGPDLRRVFAMVAEANLPVPVAQVLPLAEAGRAQQLVEQGGTGGKIILRP